MGGGASTPEEQQNYINAFVKAAAVGNIEFVRACLDEHPEVIDAKETYNGVRYNNSIIILLFITIMTLCS